MLVVDTSAMLEALGALEPSSSLVERLAAGGDVCAPHLIDVEVLNVLRRLCLGGHLSDDRAADVRSDFEAAPIIRFPHDVLADRIWDLRHGMTACDAAFVALAEALDAPLVTCDKKLAGASGHDARIELLGRGR